MVAQLTAEVRTGKEFLNNDEWRQISAEYPYDIMTAAYELDKWPKLSHRLIHLFLPSWKKLRTDIEQARAIFTPVIEAKRAKRREGLAKSEDAELHYNLSDQLDDGAKGRPLDSMMAQMIAMHTMIVGQGEVLSQIIFDLCESPQTVQDLREEIVLVLGKEGLTKKSLANLHLLDSVAKESQRLLFRYNSKSQPISNLFSSLIFIINFADANVLQASVRRYAEQTITMSDGVVIPKGTLVVVANNLMRDETKYPNPHEFQGDRFLKQRQLPGCEAAAKLTTATEAHAAFGFGKHVCPGRFYAANLIKLALCHIILKYDLRLVGGVAKLDEAKRRGAEIEVRRRSEEVNIERIFSSNLA